MRVRGNLQLKLVVTLLVVGMVPVVISTVLIGKISEAAQNFASQEAEQLRSLERAQGRYRSLVELRKAQIEEVGRRIAAREDLLGLGLGSIASEAGLVSLRFAGQANQQIQVRDAPAAGASVLTRTFESAHGPVEMQFAVDPTLASEYRELGRVLADSEGLRKVRASLPASYRTAFLIAVGGSAVLLTLVGVFLGRRVTQRAEELVDATRSVAKGDLTTRVEDGGEDELGELSRAFNRMVADLDSERRKSAYLQRIGAWQDVARRLAHEIKNPLTPIQLAVQQLQSSYNGDDERFSSTLGTAVEIVEEEILSLRRLVDAFSTLGRLPRVDAKAFDFALVASDLKNDPIFSDGLVVRPPEEPVSVRGDRLLLRRVVANLVENGLQAGGPGVELAWRAQGDRVVITVDDRGPGIAPEKTETIFEPYVTTKETGTGLGLAISMKIAMEHGGSLEVARGNGPLGGASLELRVPLADGVAPAAELNGES